MTKFHIDSRQGDDSSDGLTPQTAWRTLARSRQQQLAPGDALLLRRGCTWTEPVRITGSGNSALPITLGTYGSGPKPRVVSAEFPLLSNDGPVSWWHIKGIELRGERPFDPHGAEQGSAHGIALTSNGGCDGMTIEDCVIHDVDGKGVALIAMVTGKVVFGGCSIVGCEVFNAGTGIATDGPWPPPANIADAHGCNPGLRVAGCSVHDIATDGIVLHYCQDAVIDRCRAWRTGIGRCQRTPVGIWFFLALRSIIQRCESYDNHTAGGKADGGGFDLDGGCIDCIMQYNYSHDNDGAGFLVCSYDPVQAPCKGNVTRYNISVNDGRANDYAAIQFWQADDCLTYNNTCVTRISSGLKFASTSKGNLFANNIFCIESAGRVPVITSPFPLDGVRFRNNVLWSRGDSAFVRVMETEFSVGEMTIRLDAIGNFEEDPNLVQDENGLLRSASAAPVWSRGMTMANPGARDVHGDVIVPAMTPSIGAAARPRAAARIAKA